MTDLQKYNLINRSETPEELKQSLKQIAKNNNNMIPGRRQDWSLEEQLRAVDIITGGTLMYNLLTRTYGIRQQMMYIMHYARS